MFGAKTSRDKDEGSIYSAEIPAFYSQLVGHCIYWGSSLIKRLEGDFEFKNDVNDPKNWLSNEILKERGWRNLKEELKDSQDKVIHHLLKNTSGKLLKTEYRQGDNI